MILGLLAIALTAAAAAGPAQSVVDRTAYAGSERCRDCHGAKYEGWKETFHATVVQDVKKNPAAVLGDFSAPGLGFSLDDVEYTIGGHWDQRYMKKMGDDYYVLPKLWSVQARTWRPYNVWAWKKMPYGKYCKGCHVTGYDPAAGTVTEDRVGCEACHGPGAAHARSDGKEAVVNPAKLPEELKDMVCAACHVRGQDTTGVYYFPVGYTPGQDLGAYYVPTDKAADETNRQAIVRNFAKWKKEKATQSKTRCDVCGIPGASEEKGDGGAADFCFSCHDFKGKYSEHTRHPAKVDLVCFDCHVQQTKEIMNPQNLDIHSYAYFLVHTDNCYDRQIEQTCDRCHADKGTEWARRTVEGWRKPVEIKH